MRRGWEWALPGSAKAPSTPEDVEDAQPLKRGAFDAFGGTRSSSGGTFDHEDTAPDTKVTEDAGHEKAEPSAPSAREWRITRANGDSFTTCTTPPATLVEMREMYPGATVEPVREAGA